MKKYNNNGAVPIVCVYDEMAGGGGSGTHCLGVYWDPCHFNYQIVSCL